MSNAPRYITTAVVTYFIASYGSYKYGLITKAQTDLRNIVDKKKFLHETHDKLAESYDKLYERRDFSNKINKYRKTLLTYAEGRTLELGCGTGANLPFFTTKVTELVAVDWSANMLMKAMNRE
jgi:ubiquinone/menaquinone biosynthesis C-methylase UbiE